MKSQVFVLCGLFVGTLAHAQPPAKSEATKNPPVFKRTDAADDLAEMIKGMAEAGPVGVASMFLSAMQGGVPNARGERNWEIAALCIMGLKPNSPAVQQLKFLAPMPDDVLGLREWRISPPDIMAEKQRVAKLNLKENDAVEIELPVSATGALGVELTATEKITLRRETLKWPAGLQNKAGEARVWRIVAPDWEASKKTQIMPGAINTFALLMTNAEPRKYIYDTNRLVQAKNLALKILDFENAAGSFDFNADNWREKLKPYVKDQSLWANVGDAPDAMTYSINLKLAGKKWEEIKAPERTVLAYLGKDEKLDTRFNGRAAVAFLDGNVQFVYPDQVLNWEP